MKALFAGSCARCGHAIKKGEEIDYDRESKKAYHPDCHDSGAESPEDLADRLGFLPHDVAMGTDWILFRVPDARGSVTAGRTGIETHRDESTKRQMPTGVA